MVKKSQITAFINYGYIPFKKGQCIRRIFVILISSAGLCLIGTRSLLWSVSVGIADLLVVAMFSVLMVKYSSSPISRYLCDGVFSLYIAIILNLGSYRTIALQIGSNLLILIMLMSMLIVCILVFIAVNFSWIKSDKFANTTSSKTNAWIPAVSGVVGMMLSRGLLQGKSLETVLTVISCGLLIMSFIMSLVSINLLKAWFYVRLTNK